MELLREIVDKLAKQPEINKRTNNSVTPRGARKAPLIGQLNKNPEI